MRLHRKSSLTLGHLSSPAANQFGLPSERISPKLGSRFSSLAFCFLLLTLLASCGKRDGDPRILVFSKTSGYHHSAIDEGNKAIVELGNKNGFAVDTTTNSGYIQEDSLKKYAAVVFLNTTGDVLNHYQEADFERYIQAGGGFVGVHSATDTEYDWGWYGRLVGAYFNGHPDQQEAVVRVTDEQNEATEHLPKEWKRKDEWYNFKNLSKDVKVLLTLDEKSYKGGTNGANHPVAWYHDFDGGRAFYTALGHTEESYQDNLFLQHLLAGLEYAIGDNKELDYEKATALRVPEEDRFVKTVLTQGKFTEPTEMTILPNLDILVAQRRGELMYYNQGNGSLTQAGFLDVYHTSSSDANAEEGLMGLAKDPDFAKNNFIFLYYSPADTSVNRLSRFVFRNGKLDMASEKIVLELYSQRQICCHTGGSIAFGPDNLLYLSTGDNSTPFDEKGQTYTNQGYAPLDDREGHLQYDARRTSGNTNDLRGKVIRIKVKADGSYEIPAGNLFPKNQAKTRPEIYTMGHRNPYRISVDQKTGFLYWGEVGPDAKTDSLATRGPKGYDEVNQARKAGNYGWPLFVANNYPYLRYNYGTGTSGEAFNPAKPVNDSRNNTGLVNLPAAQPAFIWYPYDASPDFPQVGTGGRNAMAGPVYYTDMFPENTRYAQYYHGKLFIYDWIRDWIKVVTMKKNGDFDKMEPFMENEKFAAIMDMEVGPDGKIYILEYGKGWFTGNPDAALSRVDYLSGNRPPKITNLTVDRQSGLLPFTVTATVEVADPEKDNLRYLWTVNGLKKLTDTPQLEHTFTKAGDYDIRVEVTDTEKATSGSKAVTVYAGNEQPDVVVALPGNRSFYFEGTPIKYQVHVATPGGQVKPENLFVSAEYIEGKDLAGASMGHQVASATLVGRTLMENSDCKGCHKIDEKSIGPSYVDVSKRYLKDGKATSHLTNKIIKGGGGVWGENAMPAHPDMSEADARQIVSWILSLASPTSTKPSLPAKGEIVPRVAEQKKENTVLKLTATYTHEGGTGLKPLVGSNAVQLRSNRVDVSEFKQVKGFTSRDSSGSKYLVFPASEGWIKETLDLTDIGSIELSAVNSGYLGTYAVEVRIGTVNGQKIGSGRMAFGPQGQIVSTRIPIQAPLNLRTTEVYLICKEVTAGGNNRPLLKTVTFTPQGRSTGSSLATVKVK
ncbi:ThuA domain-containing protein [Rufibacter latericius]|uniref:PKD domain-containing protein n=1 Tax=Rufibacter latericius TaxID=2487040 RepID=A0A3M9N026_9BACT|nr:ThuA domain-containing protein [Rufibacter latericius]RNI31076.1 PKD domain-containing protein [Rufibacter latericius]